MNTIATRCSSHMILFVCLFFFSCYLDESRKEEVSVRSTFLCKGTNKKMGKIVYYANSRNADVESAPPGYNTTIAKFISGPSASSSANEPSAPPDEGSYSYQQQQQPLNIQQPTNYLTIPTPANPQYVMRYIIKSKNGNDRHFPVNAAIFLLGL